MKNIEFTKRLMALLSATTIALSMGSCGKNDKDDSSFVGTKITTEAEDLTTHYPGFEEVPTQNTEENIEETTEIVETIPPINSEPTRPEPTIPSAPTLPTESLKPTESPETKPQATKPTETQPEVTIPTEQKPTESPKVEKLTVNNINNVAVIDALANSAHRYMYSVNNDALYTHISYTHNGSEYICDTDEFRMFIALLNEQYLDEETLKELFGEMTLDDINRCGTILSIMSQAFCSSDMTIKYDQFVVDPDMCSFLNELQRKMKEYRSTGNIEEFNKFVISFYENKDLSVNHNDNLVIDCYVRSLFGMASKFYDNVELSYFVTTNSGDTGIYNEYISIEFYSKTRDKQLIK